MRFLLMIRNDALGASRMLQGLTAGWDEFDGVIQRFGGNLVELYAVAGRYDAVVIADFEDPASILAFALAATAQGQYIEALPVFGRDDAARAEAAAREAAASFAADAARVIDAASAGQQQEDPR